MPVEARLEPVGSGLAPSSDGWFVVNVRDSAWLSNQAFGGRCVFEADVPVVRGLPDRDVQRFPQLGVTLTVVAPGQPSGLYHAESNQEDFLVLSGECLLVVEGTERRLGAWDFVHCPPGTEHVFVGAGESPCAILMVGRRSAERTIVYPDSELARRHGAGAEHETRSAADAYAPFPHWQRGRPPTWQALPWA
jgi:uncharacterized cupin superfamily protein